MTIKQRIFMSSILLLTLFLVMVGINWFGNYKVSDKTTKSYLLGKATMHIQGIFRGVNEFIIDEGEPISIELTNEHTNGFDELHNQLLISITEPELAEILNNTIKPQWQIVKDGVLAFLKNNPYISVEDDAAMLQYGRLTTEAKKLYKDVQALSMQTKEIAEATAKTTKNVVSIVAGSILLITAFLLINLYRTITTPIKEITRIAEGFGSGDLGVLMNESRKDEFGVLAKHLNMGTEKLSTMLANVKAITSILYSSSEKLSDSAQMIASNAREQSSQTDQVASAIDEMTASFMEVASKTSDAASSAKGAVELAFESADIITHTVESMNHISKSADESTGTIEALGQGSSGISAIVKVINDIAGQTNLLALNAAIEAARAGEQGRGFAVVADEVRKLAEKTTSSTSEIGDMIKNIQGNTRKTIESLEGWTGDVQSGLESAGKAGGALQEIVMAINNVTDMVQQVATAAEEQSTTANVISTNVESIANLTQNTAVSAEQSSEATGALSNMARELQDLISGFKLRDEVKSVQSNHADHQPSEQHGGNTEIGENHNSG